MSFVAFRLREAGSSVAQSRACVSRRILTQFHRSSVAVLHLVAAKKSGDELEPGCPENAESLRIRVKRNRARFSQDEGCRLPVRSAALFVFLARATGTRIIAADFSAATYHLLNGLSVAGSGHARLLEFTLLTALEGFFEIVH
jgi:hypothetical protein